MKQTLFTNATIHTMNPGYSHARSFVCHNGIIRGLDVSAEKKTEPTERIDLAGGFVLPGLTDSHVHLLMFAETLITANLTASVSEQHAVEMLKSWADTHDVKPGQWIRGRGWAINRWTPDRMPTCESLDRFFPDNPVYLSSQCGHLIWVNSAALQAAGIKSVSRESLEQWGDQITFGNDGTPTGLLSEAAEDLVFNVIPPISQEQQSSLLRKAITHFNHLGILSVHDMESFNALDVVLSLLQSSPRFTMRIAFYIQTEDFDRLEKTARDVNSDPKIREYISVEGVKFFVDGSLGGRTAWMDAPYDSDPANTGICVNDAQHLFPLVYEANKRGLCAAVHAIGDRAVKEILTVYGHVAEKLKTERMPPVKNRIEHFQLINKEILELTAEIQPIVAMQPIHLPCDWHAADIHWGKRSRWAYAFASVLKTGSCLMFGSDAPVESPNPWEGLQAAVTRQDFQGQPEGGWYPEEKISVSNALMCYTAYPAQGIRLNNTGSIKPGNKADFVVVTKEPMTEAAEALHRLEPSAVYFDGEKVVGQ